MKNKIKWLLLCLVLIFSLSNSVFAKAQPISIKVNNQTRRVYPTNVEVNGFHLQTEFVPFADQGRTFVPIREITELMGAKVDWQQKSNSVNIQLRDSMVKLKINSNIVYVNGKKVNLSSDSVPKLVDYKKGTGNSKTMVPLRFLSESFGFKVDWNQKDFLVSVSNNAAQAPKELQTEKQNSLNKISEPSQEKPVSKTEMTNKVEPIPTVSKKTPTESKDEGQDKNNVERVIGPEKKVGPLTVVVDPGHGGKDDGATAIDNQKEKDLNLQVAKKLIPLLQSKGYDIVLTRNRDEYLALAERASIANNKNAEIFISIHFNSSTSEKAHGIEVLYASEENVEIKTTEQKHLAKEILNALIKETGSYSRGIKNRPDIAVLKRTEMTAALVELGFLSNREDMKDINSPGYLDKLARGIYNGIVNYENAYMQ